MPTKPPVEYPDVDTLFARRVVCAIIEQAVFDAKSRKTFKRDVTQQMHDRDKECAIQFLNSKWFNLMCNTLQLPSDKIRESVK
jgi:hypothetical protein